MHRVQGVYLLARSIMFSRSCSLSSCDLSYARLMAACRDSNVLLDLKVEREGEKNMAYRSSFPESLNGDWSTEQSRFAEWGLRDAEWGNFLSLLFFSETWLILGKFSLKETHSWYGYAAVRALQHYFLNVKCSWVFLWNVTSFSLDDCFFTQLGERKAFSSLQWAWTLCILKVGSGTTAATFTFKWLSRDPTL